MSIYFETLSELNYEVELQQFKVDGIKKNYRLPLKLRNRAKRNLIQSALKDQYNIETKKVLSYTNFDKDTQNKQ